MARQSDEREEEKASTRSMQEKGANGDRRKTDAIEMLKADHRRVEQLFEKYEQAKRRAEKSKLAQQICLELTIHAELEEEIFYPACREHVDDPLLDEAQVEHDTAKILIAEVAMGAPQSDPFFDAKVKVLGEYIRHHVQEEEKSAESIFNKAQEGGVDTAKLGERMMARREELMEDFSEELLLPQPKTLHLQLEQEEEVWSEPPGRGASRGQATQGRGGERESWESRHGEEGRGWEDEERGYDERRAARGGGQEERGQQRSQQRGQERGYDERRSARGAGGGHEEEGRGWRGEPERHAQAARRGWEEREGGGGRGRESERGRAEEGRTGGGRGEEGRTGQTGGGRGGWFGDPKRHSEASRRGSEHRR